MRCKKGLDETTKVRTTMKEVIEILMVWYIRQIDRKPNLQFGAEVALSKSQRLRNARGANQGAIQRGGAGGERRRRRLADLGILIARRAAMPTSFSPLINSARRAAGIRRRRRVQPIAWS